MYHSWYRYCVICVLCIVILYVEHNINRSGREGMCGMNILKILKIIKYTGLMRTHIRKKNWPKKAEQSCVYHIITSTVYIYNVQYL